MASEDLDPWGGYYFSVEIDKVEIGHYREVSGLKSSAAVFEIEEGGYNGHVHKRTGQSKWENIVLRYGTSSATALMEWRDRYLQDKFGSRTSTTGAIIMRNNSGTELRRFTFVNAWPVSWEGPSLNSGSSDVAVETLEIAHEGLFIGGPPPPAPEPAPPPPKNFAPDTIQFELDSDKLTPEGQATVDEISKSIEDSDSKEFWIEGHTCTLGPGGEGSAQSAAYNKDLSQRRAQTVADALKAKHPDKTFHTSGYGFDHPVASNSTGAGKVANRRTDVFDGAPPAGRKWLK